MLDISKRRQNNFDITRLCLAIFVYLGHYTWIFPNGPLPVGIVMFLAGEGGQRSVQAFFIISGFLMFQSFERSDRTSVFFEKRIRRIIPGYVTVILFSAFFGFWLSNLKLSEYFSIDLIKYVFWNLLFLNFMHPNAAGPVRPIAHSLRKRSPMDLENRGWVLPPVSATIRNWPPRRLLDLVCRSICSFHRVLFVYDLIGE